MFRDLSFRYKIPLRGTALIFITAFIVTSAFIIDAYKNLKQDLLTNAEEISSVMAHTLVPALRNDDVWQAYEIIRSPFKVHEDKHLKEYKGSHPLQSQAIIIVTNSNKIYSSSHPKRFPILADIQAIGLEYNELSHKLSLYDDISTMMVDASSNQIFHVVTPIISDGVKLGTLVMEYSRDSFNSRFFRFAARALFITILIVGALLPLSWYWGARLADPLIKLASCMGMITRKIPDNLTCNLYESKDEIGVVGTRFKQMLVELKEKQLLEHQVIVTERLTAIGRITAGVAHEINNPLGGMTNAINTFKRYGEMDEMTKKTISLIERGLLQIEDTVSALLIDTKPSDRFFSANDVDDLHTLIAPEILKKSATIQWTGKIDEIPIPATLVRQVLMNLLLNAAKSVPNGGKVIVDVSSNMSNLNIVVSNQGEAIESEQLEHLFEPFVQFKKGGSGLGLWVCYQIIEQLEGLIGVSSDDDMTTFTVIIPLPS
ncbi:MAG: ATP-binding protein [Chromatiales bacterium]|nr:ATP-binding protein [Chromatiales bacterium]